MDAERDRYYAAMPREGRHVGRCEMLLPDDLMGKRVLDLGCRRGKGACKIADRVGPAGSVLGVDPSPTCIEAARAYAVEHAGRRALNARDAGGLEGDAPSASPAPGATGDSPAAALSANPSFTVAPFEDVREAGVGDGSMDVVYANSVLNLAWDRDATLREAVRVLAPGGVLHHVGVFAEAPLPDDEARAFAAAGNVFGAADSLAGFEAAALAAGFRRCEVGEPWPTEPDGDDAAPALEGRRFVAAVVCAFV